MEGITWEARGTCKSRDVSKKSADHECMGVDLWQLSAHTSVGSGSSAATLLPTKISSVWSDLTPVNTADTIPQHSRVYVTEIHYAQCGKYPVVFPNGCDVHKMEQQDLK